MKTPLFRLRKKNLSLPALLGATLLAFSPFVGNAFANSGGKVVENYDGNGTKGYIGSYQPDDKDATGGKVVIDQNFNGVVLGGYSKNGNAIGNTLTLNSGKVLSAFGGFSENKDAIGNILIINGGDTDEKYHVYGGNSNQGKAYQNMIILNGGKMNGSVYGGRSAKSDSNRNIIIIHGGYVAAAIYGGNTHYGNANQNTIRIYGGYIGENVYGGENTEGAKTHGNTVSLFGSPVFGKYTYINGGLARLGTSEDNTLNVFTSGLKAANINFVEKAARNTFQIYNFGLPTNGKTGLTLTGKNADKLNATKPTDFANKGTFDVPYALGGGRLNVGDTATLLENKNGLDNVPASWNGQTGTVEQGMAFIYTYTIKVDATGIRVRTDNRDTKQEVAALPQSRSVGISALTMGSDLVAGTGLSSAVNAASDASTGQNTGLASGNGYTAYGITPFAALSGGGWRVPGLAGSSARVNGAVFMTGFAKKWQSPSVNFTLGTFFEGSYAKSSGTWHATASKNTNNALGGGILGRADINALPGLYAEGSLRMGSLNQDYSGDFGDVIGRTASYKKSNLYYGLHAGLGYAWKINPSATLDVYAKYFWNHVNGFDATIADDMFNFKAVNSHRTRLGARLDYAFTEKVSAYTGLAWEQELAGTSRVSLYGLSLPSPSVKGATGVGEIGFRFIPDGKSSSLAIDLAAQGFVGKRLGAMGSVMLSYAF